MAFQMQQASSGEVRTSPGQRFLELLKAKGLIVVMILLLRTYSLD